MPIGLGAAYLAGQGLNALGGLFKKDWSKQTLAEQAREFNLSQQYAEEQGRSQTQMDQVKALGGVQHQIEGAPLRDKVLYMLNQRAGMVPQNFQPRDMANPWTQGATNPQQGGIDPQALQQAMSRYRAPDFNGAGTPGSGGIDPAMYHQMMSRLGYSYGEHGIRDIPIQQSTYSNPFADRPKGPPGPPTNPNGSMTPPGMPNGPKVNPGPPPPSTWGGGGMPGSLAPPAPPGPPGDLAPPVSPQQAMQRRPLAPARRY